MMKYEDSVRLVSEKSVSRRNLTQIDPLIVSVVSIFRLFSDGKRDCLTRSVYYERPFSKVSLL